MYIAVVLLTFVEIVAKIEFHMQSICEFTNIRKNAIGT